MVEEAKRRDHRKIGRNGLYAIDTDLSGQAATLAAERHGHRGGIGKLAKETEFQAGYVRVKTPHIAKEKMYLTSGHLPILYKESMFPPMGLDEFSRAARVDGVSEAYHL